MTPAAKPVNMRYSIFEIESLRKNTMAAPKDVPKNGSRTPVRICVFIPVSSPVS